MIHHVIAVIVGLVILAPSLCIGEEFSLSASQRRNVIGGLQYTRVSKGDSLLDIGRAFDIGHDQIIRANPKLNRWIPRVGAEVVIPSVYLLPPGKREGIVLNLAELRLYFYPRGKRVVHTYPVSIGDVDWRTPLGTTIVASKEIDPAWYPPKSIREEHAGEGEELPRMIPGGDPDNPLGHFALKLGIPGYLIHGTDLRRSFGIGMRVSHGCIRLYPEDIEPLYGMVPVGTPVRIIDQPVKAAWHEDELVLEVHHPLIDDGELEIEGPSLRDVVEAIEPLIYRGLRIDVDRIEAAFRLGDGIPVVIARKNF